jgi:hypothetical protein
MHTPQLFLGMVSPYDLIKEGKVAKVDRLLDQLESGGYL